MEDDNRYYDIHTHFLPSMDLGCDNTDVSMQMIRMMCDQSCEGVIATPHFYPTETTDTYLRRRADKYNQLREVLLDSEYADFEDKIILGTEVAYHHSILFETDIMNLCLGESNYLLLEMPFARWSDEVLEDVDKLMKYRGVRIIIAHLERFYEYGNKKRIERLLEKDVTIQMNTAHLLKFGAFHHAHKMIKEQRVDILSTDCHGTFFYPPNMTHALEKMRKAGLEEDMTRMLRNNAAIYKMSKD